MLLQGVGPRYDSHPQPNLQIGFSAAAKVILSTNVTALDSPKSSPVLVVGSVQHASPNDLNYHHQYWCLYSRDASPPTVRGALGAWLGAGPGPTFPPSVGPSCAVASLPLAIYRCCCRSRSRRDRSQPSACFIYHYRCRRRRRRHSLAVVSC